MREDHHEASSNRKSKSINASSKKLHHQQQKSMNLSSVIAPITTEGDAVLSLSEKESIEKISSISAAIDADSSTVDISRTNLNSDQNLVSDNTVAIQFPEDSVRISPMSEAFVFDEDQLSIESYIASLNQHISPSFMTSSSVEVTPLSSKSPVETPLSSITSLETTPPSSTFAITTADAAINVPKVLETKSVKLQSLAKHLKESIFQVLHSSDIDPNHKKLLDALVKMVIEEFCSLHEERGFVAARFSNKAKVLLLSYLLVMLLVSAGFFLLSNAKSSYHGPTPT